MSIGKLRFRLAIFALIAIVLAAWMWIRDGGGRPHPLPPIASSDFLNTAPQVAYVGSSVCKDCHAEQHESFSRTQHSIALRDVSAFPQPEGAECEHPLSGRRYRVYLDEQTMRHREFLSRPNGDLVLADHAPTLAMGSGSHSHTYLIEVDGFLMESPITFYNPKSKWDLSPGYHDLPDQPGFSRPINTTCVNCHSGGATQIESLYRFSIREQAVSCERCHGPGKLHVDKWRAGDAESGEQPDLTIVNPARLSDERVDAVCSQCHLEGVTRISIRGRREEEFRPGLRFQDFEVAYRVNTDDSMKVVGHVEQMRMSACFQKSGAMTCITCHDPHDPPAAENRLTYFRNACLQCHEAHSCRIPEEERLLQEPADDCNACHMPKSKVNVPHVAFTHHRIGVHKDETPPPAARNSNVQLVPLNDISHLPKIEQDRCLGLAYLELSGLESPGALKDEFAFRALNLLEGVRADGLRDAAVDSALARIYVASDKRTEAIRYAKYALAYEEITPSVQIDALDTLASAYVAAGDWSRLAPILEKLTQLRRDADDWQRLGRARYETGDGEGAQQAARQAVAIAPHRPDLHFELAGLSSELGDATQARKHREIAEAIEASARYGRPAP